MSGGQNALRVVEIGYHPATALCGKLLAALGMEVSRLDADAGTMEASRPSDFTDNSSFESHRRLYLDAGKGAAFASTRSPSGSAALAADVLLASDPAVLVGGKSVDALRTADPRVVVAVADERGDSADVEGPGIPDTGFQAMALSGFLSIVGEADREPLRIGGSQAEYATALSLFSGVLFALYRRDASGTGATVSSSALRSLAYMDWKTEVYHEREGKRLVRGSRTGPAVVRCLDGYLGLYYRPEDWPAVKEVLGLPDGAAERFATQKRRDDDRDAFAAAIEAITIAESKHDLCSRLQARGVPAGAVLTVSELLEDEQYASRGFLQAYPSPSGRWFIAPAMPWTIDGARELPVDGVGGGAER